MSKEISTQAENTHVRTSGKGKTYDMAYIGIFTVLIAICSWISIPMQIPFTLQTFAIFLAVAVLGGRRGTLSAGSNRRSGFCWIYRRIWYYHE